jgi:hypothetical protein
LDQVNNPSHYTTGNIEAIDYMKDNMSKEAYHGYLEGCCKKYLHRHAYKGNQLTDLKKARWYLDRLILELETQPKVIAEDLKKPMIYKPTPGTVAYQEHG